MSQRLLSFLVLAISFTMQSRADENRRAGADFTNATELKTGVEMFNAQVNRISEIGKEQSPLTVDEVVAAIRAWDLKAFPIAPELLTIFRNIAEKKTLPPGSSLDFTSGWQPNNEFEYTVWWITISVSAPNPEKENSKVGYSFLIRDRKLSSRVARNSLDGPERKLSGVELQRYIAETITTNLTLSQP